MHRLQEVVTFRNRLVAYINLAFESRPHNGAEQIWLSQTYGRLFKVIHPSGIPQAMAMGYGTITTSHDVIADAINRPGRDTYYNDLARIADQYLTMRIGQMEGEAQERAAQAVVGPDTLYRLTSPLFWLGRLWALLRWLIVTKGGRLAALIGTVLLALAAAFVSGWAQALFGPK